GRRPWQHATRSRAPQVRPGRAAALGGERDDRWRSGRRRNGAEEIDLEVEHDHVRLHRCDLAGQGPARWGDQETETRAPANHPVETRTRLRPRGDDEDASHGTATPARRRKPRTATVGTARARPPWIIAFTPRTRPRSSASGPPEFPGASRRSA